MFTFRKKQNSDVQANASPATAEKPNLFKRLVGSLNRTRLGFTAGLANLVLGKKVIDDDLLEAIETQLLQADVGVTTTQKIIQEITQKVARNELANPEALIQHLKTYLINLLQPCEQTLNIETTSKPFVVLMIGINGAGKTTTLGKMAYLLQQSGKKVLLAAGDTFRAAAVEQLQVWGERQKIPVIAQQAGADSASVIYDALQAAQAREVDVLLADTAGRLHTKDNLLEELRKVKRVLTKLDATAPHEVLLVLDAGTGQNALVQAQQFHQALGVTGLVLTKLDGTAKGGVIFAIADQLQLPIRYIGIGEAVDDLRPFKAEEFINALFAELTTTERNVQ